MEISVNESLSGTRLDEEEYRQKAEENMMNLMQEKEENRMKFRLTVVVGMIATISFITLLLVAIIYADAIELPVRLLIIVIACALFAVGMYVAMEGERTIGYYKCGHCGERFIPGFGQYTMGIHMLTTRRLKCPCCGQKSWCKKVMAKED